MCIRDSSKTGHNIQFLVKIAFNLIPHMDICNFFTILIPAHFCLPLPIFDGQLKKVGLYKVKTSTGMPSFLKIVDVFNIYSETYPKKTDRQKCQTVELLSLIHI